LFSVRHQFPGEWTKFKSGTLSNNAPLRPELSLNLREEHYPFWSRGSLETIKRADMFAKTAKGAVEITTQADGGGQKDTLVPDASLGNLRAGMLKNVLALPKKPTGEFTFYLNDQTMTDLWLALAWGKE